MQKEREDNIDAIYDLAAQIGYSLHNIPTVENKIDNRQIDFLEDLEDDEIQLTVDNLKKRKKTIFLIVGNCMEIGIVEIKQYSHIREPLRIVDVFLSDSKWSEISIYEMDIIQLSQILKQIQLFKKSFSESHQLKKITPQTKKA